MKLNQMIYFKYEFIYSILCYPSPMSHVISFQVISTTPSLLISFKNSKIEYDAADILGNYFESISNFASKKIGIDVSLLQKSY